jgi:hypothetical protein
MCGKNPSQFSFTTNKTLWLDASFNGTTFDGSTLYDVYDSNIDGTSVWTGSGDHYYGIIESGSNVQYIVYISSSGKITEWYSNCGGTTITPTPTPTATVTPTPTPYYYQVDILRGNPGDCGDTASACYSFNTLNTSPNYTIFTTSGTLGDGETAYVDGLGPDGETFIGGPGPGYYYTDGSSYARISSTGLITVIAPCGICN